MGSDTNGADTDNELFVPPTIKKEPFTDWNFEDNEKIDLLSDDDNDNDVPVSTLQKSTISGKKISANRAPAPSQPIVDDERVLQQVLKKQEQMIERFREKHAPIPTDGSEHISQQDGDSQRSGKKTFPQDTEAAKFQKLKEAFLEKKKAQTVTAEEEIAFIKAESAESARLRKLEADYEFDNVVEDDEENDAFSTSNGAGIPSYNALHSDDERPKKKKRGRQADDDGEDQRPKKRGKGNKGNKKDQKVAGTDYTEGDLDDVLASAKGKSKAKAKKNAAPKAKAGGRKKNTGPSMTNISSLWSSNVVEDATATAGLAEQPTFDQQSRRKEALNQLIASVPEENLAVAKSDKKFLEDAIKQFNGHASVKSVAGGLWLVAGMRTPLKHFQVLGTAFMLKRENGSQQPFGGIMADQMGLGKTIMTLANIINNKPRPRAKARATLIVASPALITQWFDEIRMHLLPRREDKHGVGRVIQYRSGSRMKSNEEDQVIEEADIVLTTYSEVCKSYPKAVVPPDLTTAAQKDEWWREFYDKNRGILHRVRFHRVVIDEAQAIKNHQSHTSMACRALDTRHAWAITGTPILNGIKEFYSLFKFIREEHTGSYRAFKLNFCSPDDPDGIEKLSVFLRKVMIRRTHLDTLFNAKLLNLPQPQEHTIWLEFSDVERVVYEIVKKRFIQHINTMSKDGSLEKEYHHIWCLILRLRQICAHVLLVQSTITDLLEFEDYQKLQRITESEQEMSDEGAALLLHLRGVLENKSGAKVIEGSLGSATLTENEISPLGVVDFDGMTGDVGGTHGVTFRRFRKYLDNFVGSQQFESLKQRTLCCGCRQPPHDPYVTSCGHAFCHNCLKDSQHLAARRGYDSCRCPECGEAYTSAEPCAELAATQLQNTQHTSSTPKETTQTKKSAKAKKSDPSMDWIELDGAVLASAKTHAIKAQVLNWKSENPDAKIIVFTQWVPFIRILSKVCRQESWGYVEYMGTMSLDAREKAIKEFREDSTKTILLASLKCGGLGLNLTCASRVICVDPWFNNAVEDQAFCRVFRIGQEQTTCLTKLVVKNTIESAIMALKERKQIEIDEIMSETKRKENITVRDLMRLFGTVEDDEEGRPFIFPSQNELMTEHLRMRNGDEEDEEDWRGNEA